MQIIIFFSDLFMHHSNEFFHYTCFIFVSLDDVERELGVPVLPVAQDGYELLDAMCGIHVEQPAISAPVPEDEYYRYNPGTRS